MSDENDIAAFKEKLDANHNWPDVYMFKFIVKGDSRKIAMIESMFETDTSSIQLKNSSGGEYYINVFTLNDSSVDIKVRALVNAADYFGVLFTMNEQVKKAFDAEDITIPFPQRDVHLSNEKG